MFVLFANCIYFFPRNIIGIATRQTQLDIQHNDVVVDIWDTKRSSMNYSYTDLVVSCKLERESTDGPLPIHLLKLIPSLYLSKAKPNPAINMPKIYNKYPIRINSNFYLELRYWVKNINTCVFFIFSVYLSCTCYYLISTCLCTLTVSSDWVNDFKVDD